MNVENRELSQKLINSIEDLRKSINTISVYDFNIYSSMELYYTIANKLNELIKECYRYEVAVSDEIIKQNDCLQYLLNEGLNTEVVKKINQMVTDGIIDTIINHNVFNSLNEKIDDKTNSSNLIVNNVKMIGHRGMSAYAPENTLPAYELAAENGFWGVECDILETYDGHFILMHDDTVDRTTNGTGRVDSLTLSQIKSLDVDFGNNIHLYNNLKVPTLEEFLICCKEHSLTPVIEVKNMKTESIQKFINIIKKFGLERNVVVISFDFTLLQSIRNFSSEITLQPLLDFTVDNINACKTLGSNTHIDVPVHQVTKDLVDYAHENGILVNCWTVDTTLKKEQAIKCGVDFITTNLLKHHTFLNKLENTSVNGFNNSNACVFNNEKIVLNNTHIGGHNYSEGVNVQHAITLLNKKNRALSYTKIYCSEDVLVNVKFDTNYKMSLLAFDENDKAIRDIGWVKNGVVKLPKNTKYFYPYFGSDNDLTVDDINKINQTTEISLKPKSFIVNPQNLTIGMHNSQIGGHFNNVLNGGEDAVKRIRALKPIFINGQTNVNVITEEGYMASVLPFTENGYLIVDLGWGNSFTLPENTYFVIPYFRKADDSPILTNDIFNIHKTLIMFS